MGQVFAHPALLHFEDLAREIDKDDENHDRLWKIRDIFEM
jgi:hypothetical protein